ncbi:hypothetical protein [Herpetosiphon gulosus]|uniref:FHA domain-containing protein n=1 Tax=Herpetosiphon gulosus TaxID=1973496 RepID=A0ABP9X7B3_9CHLR
MSNKSIAITLKWNIGLTELQKEIELDSDITLNSIFSMLLQETNMDSYEDNIHIYEVRYGDKMGNPLAWNKTFQQQNIRSNSELWLLDRRTVNDRKNVEPRCIFILPTGEEILIPKNGITLHRHFFIQALNAYNPQEYNSITDNSPYITLPRTSQSHLTYDHDHKKWIISSRHQNISVNGVSIYETGKKQLSHGDIMMINGLKVIIHILD